MKSYNKLAIKHIETLAEKRKLQAQDAIDHVCGMSNISQEELNELTQKIKEKARIGIHFHPYRLDSAGNSVIQLLMNHGQYRNQFETKISNGSLTAFKGGQRDIWENELFGDIYNNHEIALSDRPKYGALDLLGHSDGPCPRFGSCYFLLASRLSNYATFTYMDSYVHREEKGTIKVFDDIIGSFLSECFERSFALGEKEVRPHELVQKMIKSLDSTDAPFVENPSMRNLDHYIEAQIHTEINLHEDVELLVADRSYQGTIYESLFEELCKKYEIQIRWNQGFELQVDEVPDHFRGPDMPKVARKVAIENKVNSYIIGKAEQSLVTSNLTGIDLQQLKYLWHTLVKYGQPILR